MESLERGEDHRQIFGCDADPVITDAEHQAGVVALRSEVDPRWFIAAELDGISDQVLIELLNQAGIGRNVRQFIPRNFCASFSNPVSHR